MTFYEIALIWKCEGWEDMFMIHQETLHQMYAPLYRCLWRHFQNQIRNVFRLPESCSIALEIARRHSSCFHRAWYLRWLINLIGRLTEWLIKMINCIHPHANRACCGNFTLGYIFPIIISILRIVISLPKGHSDFNGPSEATLGCVKWLWALARGGRVLNSTTFLRSPTVNWGLVCQ